MKLCVFQNFKQVIFPFLIVSTLMIIVYVNYINLDFKKFQNLNLNFYYNYSDVFPEWYSLLCKKSIQDFVAPTINTTIFQPDIFRRDENSLNFTIRPFAVIFVISLPESFERRKEIRSTWYSWAEEFNIQILFFLGLPKVNSTFKNIEDESLQYQDIVVDSHIESYYLLPVKVLRAVKFYLKMFTRDESQQLPLPLPKIDYPWFIKTDEDVFVNIPHLVKYLKTRNSSGSRVIGRGCDFVGGNLYTLSKPNRNPDSKFYVPYSLYDGTWWPNYIGGPFYIMSRNSIQKIFEKALKIPKLILPFEDLFLTGIVATRELGIQIHNIQGIYDVTSRSRKILDSEDKNALSNIISITAIPSPYSMKTIFEKLQTFIVNNKTKEVFKFKR